jgi:hypothetical protein
MSMSNEATENLPCNCQLQIESIKQNPPEVSLTLTIPIIII